jgi:CPA1 family monovalent cation:H+ antiporter
LPANFPYRDLIFFTSFAVVLVTLVVQGVTLRPLILWLDVRDDGTVDREVQLARVETLRAALEAVECCAGGESTELFRRRYELRLKRAEQHEVEDDPQDAEVVRAATDAERKRLIELRNNGTIGDAAFQQIEQELDIKELGL